MTTSGVSVVVSFIPVGKAEEFIFGEVKLLNASQFSVMYKGTGINAGTPGAVNYYNNVIKAATNAAIQSEMFLQTSDLFQRVYESNKKE